MSVHVHRINCESKYTLIIPRVWGMEPHNENQTQDHVMVKGKPYHSAIPICYQVVDLIWCLLFLIKSRTRFPPRISGTIGIEWQCLNKKHKAEY